MLCEITNGRACQVVHAYSLVVFLTGMMLLSHEFLVLIACMHAIKKE